MHRTTIVFPADVWERLRLLAFIRKEPIVKVVTDAVRKALDEAESTAKD